MSLAERIRQDATRVFLRQSHFAEQVIYYPGGKAAGRGRTILALIDRGPPRRIDPQAPKGRDFGYAIRVEVANDPVQGVDARTWSQQSDEIELPAAGPEAEPVLRRFTKTPFYVDAGMVKLGVV